MENPNITVLKSYKKFSEEMRKENIKSASKNLTDNTNNGILPLTKRLLNWLQLKYLAGKETYQVILLPDIP